jgi:UDP-glucuronate 4-epimerase
MKILVTGTAGFIGFHLAKYLLDRGDEVIGLDNINNYYDVNLKYARLSELGINAPKEAQIQHSSNYKKHKFIKIDISDTQAIERLFEAEKFDAVCNMAAQAGVRYSLENPHTYIQSNVMGFMNILESCRKYAVNNLSYASSSSIYGLNTSQPFKNSDPTNHPISIYAMTKKSNELMAHTYAHLYGIATTGLRFFTVYGEWGRPDMAPMLFADAILNNREIKVFNHGKMSRDFTYINDIVEGIVKVIDNPASAQKYFDTNNPNPAESSAPYRIYNIGHNAPTSLMSFIEILEKSLNITAKKQFMDLQEGDVVSTYADVSDLIKDFNYKPKTNLDIGIPKFVSWYKDFYKVSE